MYFNVHQYTKVDMNLYCLVTKEWEKKNKVNLYSRRKTPNTKTINSKVPLGLVKVATITTTTVEM